MRIAVIMATYNGERYIEQQIKSIFNQDWEGTPDLFIRDDNSKDLTLKKILELKQIYKQIKIVNDGLGNLGVKKGFFRLLKYVDDYDFVFFSDQDDIWPTNKVSQFLKCAEYNQMIGSSRVGGVYSDVWIADENAVSTGLKMSELNQWDKEDNNYQFLSYKFQVTGAALAVNQETVRLVNSLPETLTNDCSMHDAFIGLIIAILGDLIRLDKTLLFYRQHGDNQIGVKKASFRKKITITLNLVYDDKKMIGLIEEYGPKYLSDDQQKERLTYFNQFKSTQVSFMRVVLRKLRRMV